MVSDEQDEMHDEIHDDMQDMQNDVHDEAIERIAARLRPLPVVDPAARARVLVAVAAEREHDRERRQTGARRPRLIWWSVGAAVAAAAAITFAVVLPARRDATRVASTPVSTAAPAPASAPAALTARETGAAALRPVQLVFRAPAARRVSVVGDFSGWDPSGAVMTRDSGSGLWSVTLRLTPGRHVYAFLVDDSVWVSDPRAPSAPDADFGRPGSVLLVGQP